MRQTIFVTQDLSQGLSFQHPVILDFPPEFVKVKEIIYLADESKAEAVQLASVRTDMVQSHQPLAYLLTQTQMVEKDTLFAVSPSVRGTVQRFTVSGTTATPPSGRLVMTLEFISNQ